MHLPDVLATLIKSFVFQRFYRIMHEFITCFIIIILIVNILDKAKGPVREKIYYLIVFLNCLLFDCNVQLFFVEIFSYCLKSGKIINIFYEKFDLIFSS